MVLLHVVTFHLYKVSPVVYPTTIYGGLSLCMVCVNPIPLSRFEGSYPEQQPVVCTDWSVGSQAAKHTWLVS